jgi:hypothetical protein
MLQHREMPRNPRLIFPQLLSQSLLDTEKPRKHAKGELTVLNDSINPIPALPFLP